MRNSRLDEIIRREKDDANSRYHSIKEKYEMIGNIVKKDRDAFLSESENGKVNMSNADALNNHDMVQSLRYLEMRSLDYLLTDLNSLLPYNEKRKKISEVIRNNLSNEKLATFEKSEVVFKYFFKEKWKEVEKKFAKYESKLKEVSDDESLKLFPNFFSTMNEVYKRLKTEIKCVKPLKYVDDIKIETAADLMWAAWDNTNLDKQYTKAQNIRRYEIFLDSMCNIHDKYQRFE